MYVYVRTGVALVVVVVVVVVFTFKPFFLPNHIRSTPSVRPDSPYVLVERYELCGQQLTFFAGQIIWSPPPSLLPKSNRPVPAL